MNWGSGTGLFFPKSLSSTEDISPQHWAQGTCSCLLFTGMTAPSVVSRTEIHYLHFKCSVWSKSKINQTLRTTMKIHFLWNSCIIVSPIPDLTGDWGEGKKRKRLCLTSCLCLDVCVFVLSFCTNSSMHFWKSQTNLWPGCCEWGFTPTVL